MNQRPTFRALLAMLAASTVLLAGCATPDKPTRAVLYDFGPGTTTPATTPAGSALPLVLGDIDASSALDGTSLNYRLGYADSNQLRPYAQARWSAPPPQLIRQRLREILGRDRPVLDLGESAALAREGGMMPRVLRIELEEFSHLFQSQTASVGLVRMRATLLENTPAGEKLLSQRRVIVNAPAPSADAAGGVRAMSDAVNSAGAEIAQWLAQQR
ncbi:ABC-type transport auxiliary lipoprotein family protein [Caenimonas sp. SL110]|uniref:ABC-type transport auxiliary lipoprotein family protein n=1 Tax=Caenimonas sp. SL110 TaxID=1450524 RepID=UPI000654B008|nr:ABC-type transport auxiliary lipoprotein family protein [Caenimonas sp. SL110]